MSETVVLDDLARPRFPAEAAEIRDLMAAMAESCPLDVDALHRQAGAETGLSDFGPQDYRERLALLVEGYRAIPGLQPAGVVNFHAQLLQMLRNRLLLVDQVTRHPEILETELVPPVVIAGLPRTGTTHLHQLLAAAPTFRTLPYWESMEPVPMPAEVGVEPDPRRERALQATWFLDLAMPHFKLMHEMTADHVHEEIQLLANDFSSMLFETIGEVPGWREHYRTHDQTPHYAHLRMQLQVLQHLRGGRRWLLKSPQHLEQLPVLERVFPGLSVVVTHRDPVDVVVSMVSMVIYTARMHRDPVPVEDLAATWVERLGTLLDAVVRDRSAIPAERSLDVRFDDFMADEAGTARRVLELAGEPVTPEVEAGLAGYLAGHERGRLGRIEYRPADLGLDVDRLRERFAPYAARFLRPVSTSAPELVDN